MWFDFYASHCSFSCEIRFPELFAGVLVQSCFSDCTERPFYFSSVFRNMAGCLPLTFNWTISFLCVTFLSRSILIPLLSAFPILEGCPGGPVLRIHRVETTPDLAVPKLKSVTCLILDWSTLLSISAAVPKLACQNTWSLFWILLLSHLSDASLLPSFFLLSRWQYHECFVAVGGFF